MTTFDGVIHPAAEAWRLMNDEELESLAEDITANGLLDPILLDHEGALVDGRNRLRACEIAGVTPTFITLDADVDPYVVVVAKNERKNHSTGQQAMGRALIAAAAGRRKTGRWERGTGDIPKIWNTSAWREAIREAGFIIDVAEKAKHYEVGNGITQENLDQYIALPHQVRDGDIPISVAYKTAQLFDMVMANAEAVRYQELVEWLNLSIESVHEAKTRVCKPIEHPTGPRRRQDKQAFMQIKKDLQDMQISINEHLKGY